jgi:hypothetical protein
MGQREIHDYSIAAKARVFVFDAREGSGAALLLTVQA